MNLKLFGKNAIIYGMGNIGLRASSFLLIPLYTHGLSVEEYGLLVSLLLTIQILVIIMSVGMRTVLLRFTKEHEDYSLMGQLLGSTLLINAVVGIIIAGVTFFFFQPFFCSILHLEQVDEYLALTICAALVQTFALHMMSYYQAHNQALKFSMAGLSAAIILLISSVVLLILLRLGLKGALIAHILTYGAVFAYITIEVLFKKIGLTISLSLMPELLRFGFPLVFSMLGQVVMSSSSLYFLSYYEGLEVVAVYSLGYKLAMIAGIVLVLPFQLALQPLAFGNVDTPDLKEKMARLFTYYFVAVAFISISILVFSRALLPFIAPPEYAAAYLVILLMLPIILSSGFIIFGETLIGIAKKTHIMGIVVGTGGILSLLLNYVLIPLMGWYGAVVASNASSFLVGLIIISLGMKAFPMRIERLRMCIAMGVFSYFLLFGYVFQSTSNLIFYGGVTVAVGLIVPFARVTNFCDYRESAAIGELLQMIKLKLRPGMLASNGK